MVMINFKSIFVSTGIILSLIGCSKPEAIVQDDLPDRTCIAGFVQTKPHRGNIDIYTKSGVVNEVQTLEDVSLKTAAEITEELGVC